MFVAMPTAMPAEPLTSRFGKRAGRTSGSWLLPVVVGPEVDGVRVDVAQHLGRDRARGAPRCSAWRPAGRRRRSRSCPGRRRAGGASRSPAPCARACRRSTRRRAGGTCPSRRRRCAAHLRVGRFGCRPASFIANRTRRWTGLRPSRTSGSARPTMTRHRVVEIRRAHLLLERARLDVAAAQSDPIALIRCPTRRGWSRGGRSPR